jgi:putative ABC transport system permease protein
MILPLKYNVRNVFVRWRSTVATILGVALVVAVFVLMQMMATGLEKSSRNTGDPRNVMIVRKGSTAESSSQVTLAQFKTIQYLPQLARNAQGQPLAAADVVVLINLPRLNQAGEANILVRGVTPQGLELRPQVTLVAGRWFTPGKREAVVSRRLAARFANFEPGESFATGGNRLTVVGWLDGGTSAFDSELWMDADETRSMFDRENYSSVLVRPVDETAAREFIQRIESDKRLPLLAQKEVTYYAAQTMTAQPIKILGNILATAMSIGAVFAAMNTMYASVGARTREVGTLRVLGYRRRTILLSFVLEGAIIGLIGGILGCALALVKHGYTAGTMGFETFSEMVFQFQITPELVAKGLVFSVMVGVLGSLLPALRASRLPIISSLKSV